MRFSTVATLGALLAPLASARIIGIAVPDTVKPGEGFDAIIETENYIQTVYDSSIAFGITPGAGYPGALGTLLDSFFLGADKSNVIDNITVTATVPENVAQGSALISAALFSLYGASSGPVISNYNVTVTVGDHTSTNYVSSLGA